MGIVERRQPRQRSTRQERAEAGLAAVTGSRRRHATWPVTREIRRRIRSVGNMSQITRAMEMVSASKMRRAQQRVTGQPPLQRAAAQIMIATWPRSSPTRSSWRSSRCFRQRPMQNVERHRRHAGPGLTGALNSNILRRGQPVHPASEAGAPVQVIAVGKKARDFRDARGRMWSPSSSASATTSRSTTCGRSPTSPSTISSSGKVDAVYVVYARFVNTLVQRAGGHADPAGRAAGSAGGIHRLHLRAEPGGGAQEPAAALRRGPALPGDPGGDRLRALGADGRHAQRLRQRQGDLSRS